MPVITNEIGQLSDIIRDKKLGQVVTNVSEINPAEIDKIQDCRNNCAEYFKEKFDFNRKANQLLELVSDSIKENIDSNKIMAFNNDSEFHYSLSHTKQIEYYFNLASDIKKSKYNISSGNYHSGSHCHSGIHYHSDLIVIPVRFVISESACHSCENRNPGSLHNV